MTHAHLPALSAALHRAYDAARTAPAWDDTVRVLRRIGAAELLYGKARQHRRPAA